MIVYNVTVNIDPSIHQEWLDWMLTKHIPEVMATGCFLENKVLKLLKETENDGYTYAFQYLCESQAKLEEYQKNYAPQLQKDHTSRYENKFVAFRTVLEVVK